MNVHSVLRFWVCVFLVRSLGEVFRSGWSWVESKAFISDLKGPPTYWTEIKKRGRGRTTFAQKSGGKPAALQKSVVLG